MTRIYVTEIDTDSADYYADIPDREQPRRRAGFFTEESATYWHGNKNVFDGANLADVNTRDQNRGQGLYRTKQGRWVLRQWSNWQGEVDTFDYISEQVARDWLLFNDYTDAHRDHFGEPEEERGPGRPEIGARVTLNLGPALLDRVDKYAAHEGMTRAGTIRALLGAAFDTMDDTPKRYVVQYRDASGFNWEPLDGESYDRLGDAVMARDRGLAEEEEWLPKGRHRVMDMDTGEIL